MDPITSTILSTALSASLKSVLSAKGEGEYYINPTISQIETCYQAELIAKRNMLERSKGVDLFATQNYACVEGKDMDCKHGSNIRENVRGIIKSIDSKSTKFDGQKCVVSLEGNVEVVKDNFDPSFDFKVDFHNTYFNNRDRLQFTVNSNSSGFIHVFRYEESDNSIMRVYPNQFSSQGLITSSRPLNIPDGPYKINIVNKEKRSDSLELIIIMTKSKVDFLNDYTLTSFHKMYDNINVPKRMLQKTFMVSKVRYE